MTKIIKGDLILKEDTTFNESIVVEGDIKGCFDLKVEGNIDCGNIDCVNIDCVNIDCGNIDCVNIDCGNIDCRNIVCCDKIKVRKGCKVICKVLINDRFNIERKEWKIEEKKETK
jgi:hypothetical protein